MELIKIHSKHTFSKVVSLPTSKSHTNRLLILASIYDKKIQIQKYSNSSDSLGLIDLLEQIGLKISKSNNDLEISNSFPSCEPEGEELIKLKSNDGGTTNRFIFSLLSLGKRKYELEVDENFASRPNDKLFETLKKLGAKIEINGNFWKIQGPINIDKEIQVDCEKSSQFLSSLLLIAKEKRKLIQSINLDSSTTYVELTNYYLDKFENGEDHFYVPHDFSSASYLMAFAALRGEVLFEGLTQLDEYQADSKFLYVLESLGVQYKFDKNLFLKGNPPYQKDLEIDCSNYIDLTPTLIFLCSYIEGKHKLKNLSNLKYKESNRLNEMKLLLDMYEIDYLHDESKDILLINGANKISEAKFEYYAPDDHRIIMTAALFMIHNSGGTIYNYTSVSKSFPRFFDEIGVNVEES